MPRKKAPTERWVVVCPMQIDNGTCPIVNEYDKRPDANTMSLDIKEYIDAHSWDFGDYETKDVTFALVQVHATVNLVPTYSVQESEPANLESLV